MPGTVGEGSARLSFRVSQGKLIWAWAQKDLEPRTVMQTGHIFSTNKQVCRPEEATMFTVSPALHL